MTGAVILLVGILTGSLLTKKDFYSASGRTLKKIIKNNKAKIIDTSPDVDLGDKEKHV